LPDEFPRGTEDGRMSCEEFLPGLTSLAPSCLAAQKRETGQPCINWLQETRRASGEDREAGCEALDGCVMKRLPQNCRSFHEITDTERAHMFDK